MLIDDYMMEADSYRRAIEDRAATDAEVADHARRVADLLRDLEGLLSPEAKATATDLLCELVASNVMQRKRFGDV